ncbi:hypothetical protein D3C76_1500180 [compost metagenome]
MILLASTTSARRPLCASQLPIKRSVLPQVSAWVGVGYISALSIRLMPAASAASSWRWASASLFWWPQVMLPSPSTLTWMSLWPKVRLIMLAPSRK